MKKLLLLVVITTICLSAFSQKGYNIYDTVAGIVVKYKIEHTNVKDNNSPLELSFALNNTNEHNVMITFDVTIEEGMKAKYTTDNIDIKLNAGQKKIGKISNLSFELRSKNLADFETGENEWFFTKLDIKNLDTGETVNGLTETE